MKFEVKKQPKSMVEIKIEVPEEKMEDYRKKACEDISKEVKVKGFRPGHVPPHVLENFVEKKLIDAHTQEVAIQRTYAEIVIQEKIQVVSRPKVKIEKDFPLIFTATVAVLPEVEIKDHKTIKIPKQDIKVTKEDIENVINDMKKYGTTYKDVERPIKKGDRVEVDFEGYDEKDKAIENTKSKNHPVVIGEGALIPGFEDELVGLKKDEKKQFTLTFPKEYHKKDFQNKKVNFKVEIKRIEEPNEVIIDEAFIERMTGKKQSKAEFEKKIEENIKAKKEQETKHDRENKYIEELLKKTTIEIPDPLIEEELEYIVQDMKKDISMKGMEFDKFLEQNKITEEDLKKKYHNEAERRIKIRLAIQELIRLEDINVDEKEVKEDYEKIKKMYPESEQEKIEKEFNEGSLKTQIFNKKALTKLFERVLGE